MSKYQQIVDALERIDQKNYQKNYITGGGWCDQEIRMCCIAALPLAREAIEKAGALDWIMQRSDNLLFRQWLAHYGENPPDVLSLLEAKA